MTDRTIDSLTAATSLADADVMLISQSGIAKKAPGSLVLRAANNLSDIANAATARTNLGIETSALFDISEGVPASSGFSWGNQESSTISETVGKAHVMTVLPMGTADDWTIRYIAVPSTPYTLTALVLGFADANSFGSFGAGWFDGTKLQVLHISAQNAATSIGAIKVTTYSNYQTGVADQATQNHIINGMTFFHLTDDGTNVTFAVSYDGVTRITLYTVAKASGYLGASGYSNLFWGAKKRGVASAPGQVVTLRLWSTEARVFT